MGVAADITVKKNDGTTDIVWTLIAASGGDKSPALWRSNTAAGTLGQKPWFQIVAKSNGAGDVRRVDVSGKFPSVYTNTTTGQTETRSTMTFSGSFAIPQNIAQADIDEFGSQLTNLVASVISKVAVKSGFAPT
jgi:hypothetical protein